MLIVCMTYSRVYVCVCNSACILQVLNTGGYAIDTTPTGIQVRYTAQDIPISPWLTPATWTFTLTLSNAGLAWVKDGVLDLSLQVIGTTRMSYKPWPAFLHLKRGQTLSPLVPVMVGDNLNSMANRVPVVTRVARSEREKNGWSHLMRDVTLSYSGNSAAIAACPTHFVQSNHKAQKCLCC